MTDIWKDIEDFEGLYQVSNTGKVKSLITDRILKPGISSSGYHSVSLRKGGETFQNSIHRLVGKTFISNPDNLSEINHVNNIRSDNRAENLEWVTRQENVQHSIVYGDVLNAEPRKDNTSGVNGVTKNKYGRWVVRVGFKNKRIYLGVYDTFEEAKKIRLDAVEKIKKEVIL